MRYLLALPLLAGCTSTAGPFVTRVAALPSGALRVERCYVEVGAGVFGSAPSTATTDCTVETIPQMTKPEDWSRVKGPDR